MLVLDELPRDAVGLTVPADVILRGPRDDERGPGLVDEDGVHLVDDGEVQILLNLLVQGGLHVVAQIVEAQLVVRGVHDVQAIDRLARGGIQARLDRTDGEAEILVDRPHPVGVTTREVVVDRDQVAGPVRQRVERQRQSGHEGLALAGPHLRDLALMEHVAAHQLHVIVPHAEGALTRDAGQREHAGQAVVEGRVATPDTLPHLRDLGLDSLPVQTLGPALQPVDFFDDRGQSPNLAFVLGADQPLGEAAEAIPRHREFVRDVIPAHVLNPYRAAWFPSHPPDGASRAREAACGAEEYRSTPVECQAGSALAG